MSGETEDGSTFGEERRRGHWMNDEKRRIVAESFEEGTSVAAVARRHDLNTNLLFTWRRQFGMATASETKEPTVIVPVMVAPQTAPAVLASPPGTTGRMEITLSGGERIIVGSDVETAALARVVKARVVKALSRR